MMIEWQFYIGFTGTAFDIEVVNRPWNYLETKSATLAFEPEFSGGRESDFHFQFLMFPDCAVFRLDVDHTG